MSLVDIVRETRIERTPRVQQIEGIFDLSAESISREQWQVDLPIDAEPWNIGLIVGPSGSGKSTIANELFGDSVKQSFEWDNGKSIVDSFPKDASINDISLALSSVGFGSPPNWLRPYYVLSTGEKFRADLARCLMSEDLIVMDEFTSVVDRLVAQVGSHAMAKSVRRQDKQFVAISCHYDIIDWLQPDWIYDPSVDTFDRRSLQRRPEKQITIRRVHQDAWRIFSKYHYLSHELNRSAKCFVAFIDETPVAFQAIISFPHAVKPGWRVHRTVCLPDYQGLGIGNILNDKIASIMRATGRPVYDRISHPAVMHSLAKSKNWALISKPQRQNELSPTSSVKGLGNSLSRNRITAAFKYVGEIDFESAKKMEVI
jgi:ABC-type ATPase with predicted acetyltransferase domain